MNPWTLHLGDCLDPATGLASLPDKSVDHVICALMERLVADFTDPGELILDPFAGSGTTGVAAVRLGRRFIGWERDPGYHAVATKRLAGTREQLGLFAPRPRPKQETLL